MQSIHPVLSVWCLGEAGDGTGHCLHLASLSLSAHDKASKSGRNAPRRQDCHLLLGCFPLEKRQTGDKIFFWLFHRVKSSVAKFRRRTFLSKGKSKVKRKVIVSKINHLGLGIFACLWDFFWDKKVLIWKTSTNKFSVLWIGIFASLFVPST